MLGPEETRELVTKALAADPRACEALVRAFLKPAIAVALAVTGRPADAEDIAQDAFAAAFERLETCRDRARFAPWLLQIVRNRALNLVERRKFTDAVEPVEGDAGVDPPDARLRRTLVAALATLPAQQREVVLLHDLEGWTHAEIGEATGISEVLSRQHLFQARRALRATLANGVEVERGT